MLQTIQHTITSLQNNVWYALIIVCLALSSVGMLGYEFWPGASPSTTALFQRLDLIIALIFLSDFFLGLIFNTSLSRKDYFKYNWLNVISSIPITTDITQALRILRMFRAIRVMRTGMNFWFAKGRFVQNTNKKSLTRPFGK